jgi:hypothetical protein
MKIFRAAMIGAVALLVMPLAHANDIVVDDPAWLKLTAEERADVEKELKAIGALEADDRIVVKAFKDNTVSEQDIKQVISPLAGSVKSAARQAGCMAKNLFNRDKCGKQTDAAAFKSCQAKEKARHDAVAAKC